jgi:TolB-like protein
LADDGTTEAEKFDFATALMGLDPTNEQACRYILAAYGRRGDVAGATRVYGQLAEILARDHGVKPSSRTQQLIETIHGGSSKTDDDAAPAAPRRSSTAERARNGGSSDDLHLREADKRRRQETIAIYLDRFENHGVAQDRAYLVSGFRHELAACLVNFREWRVIESPLGAAASRSFAEATAYRLDGTAYQDGEVIKIVLTLLDAAQAAYVWSENFDLGLDNWFSTQQRLIRRLTSTLNVHLSAERLKRIASQPNVALTTYDSWLRAQALLGTFESENWQKARETLHEAKRASPTFSPLYSSSAQMGNIESLVFPGILMTPARIQRNIAEAKRAVQLDALDSRAHLCLSWAYALSFNFEAAAPHMRNAMELNNNDPWTVISGGALWAYAGDMDRARSLLNEAAAGVAAFGAKEWLYCAHIRYLSGDYQGALEAFEQAGEFPKTIVAWKAASAALSGRVDEAVGLGRRFLEAVRADWHGDVPASDAAIMRWLLQAQPRGRSEHWRRLPEGLAMAALPVDGAEFRTG